MNEKTRPHSIVLVEDDLNVSLMLTRHLERAGWTVLQAGTIAEARQTLRKNDWDLVLLDRALPDGDGVSLCSEIRADWKHGYVMILTGASSEEEKVEGFACGADDYITKPFNVQELLARVRAGLRIVDLQKALLTSNRQLEEISLTDSLTQLKNRRAFDQELATRFEASRRYVRPLSVAVIDVDHFKTINDTYGHQTGDSVLRGVAQVLDQSTRMTDFLARFGGEEFAVLLPETPLFEAIQFGEKIRASVAASMIRTGDDAHQVTVSVGVASVPHSLVPAPEDLVYAADHALYRAKQNGRNRVESEKRRERYAKPRPDPARDALSPRASGLRPQA